MEQFEQLLTCAICLDRYRNPKLLPCQHSFCMEPCMDGLVDYVRRQVKCPECRAEHRIPYQGVQAFPTNVTLQRFLELHIEITGELPDPTSGQTMERCGVCSEKSYCSVCVHCEKKCCPECKDAHMDILRREITRINSQVRRGLHKLQDALALVEKNTLGLQTNCASVIEEVDEIYRRLSKALKDRTEYLRNEIDRYLGAELRGLIQLKENLELEIANIQSNCDLAEAHINENVSWDDAELLDTKELFLRTVEFIRNFEYEAGDYSRRVRFVMAHDPNQLVLHVAGYGELNMKPETVNSGLLGSSGGLAQPGGTPGLMRSKSDHRLASQYRQQEEDRLSRNRYAPDYEYDTPEYEAPRNKSRYRSRFMRHRDGEDSDGGDPRSTVRFTSNAPESSGMRERVLDTEDAARGPLSGIFRLTDSPRVMRKLQECERVGKRKKEEAPPVTQPQPPKLQVQIRRTPVATGRQVSEDDEISRIKKQNKGGALPPSETVEERQPVPSPIHPPSSIARDSPQEREIDEPARRTPITRRTSADTHPPSARSASSDSSTGSESSAGSGIRSTGAPFTTEEMKQKYLSRAPSNNANTMSSGTNSPGSVSGSGTTTTRETGNVTPSTNRTFQSRFLGAGKRSAPPPPIQSTVREEPTAAGKKEEEDEDEETSSSSEETETETEEESEPEAHPTGAVSSPSITSSTPQERQRNESAMARTDIGPLLARSAEARRGSKEDSPSARYSTPRGSPAHSVMTNNPTSVTLIGSPTPTTSSSTATTTTTSTSPGGYTSRFVATLHDVTKNHEVEIDSSNSSSSSSSCHNHNSLDSADRSKTKLNDINNIKNDIIINHNESLSLFSSSSIDRLFEQNKKVLAKDNHHVTHDIINMRSNNHGRLQDEPNVDDNISQPKFLSLFVYDSIDHTIDRETLQLMENNTPFNLNTNHTDLNGPKEDLGDTNYNLRSIQREEVSSKSSEDEGTKDYNKNLQHIHDMKHRSGSSIIDEKNIEELFDDNGWVVTDQDLLVDQETDDGQTNEESHTDKDDYADDKSDESNLIVRNSCDEQADNLERRERVYRRNSLDQNGWLISDESENEANGMNSIVGRSKDKVVHSKIVFLPSRRRNSKSHINFNNLNDSKSEIRWDFDEKGWIVVNDNSNQDHKKNLRDTQVNLTIRESSIVVNNNQKNEHKYNAYDDAPEVTITLPMRIVTTVFCVSLLCYSVLMNFLL